MFMIWVEYLKFTYNVVLTAVITCNDNTGVRLL